MYQRLKQKQKQHNDAMEADTISKNEVGVKKLAVFCTFFLLSVTCLFAGNTVTRYYKQIKVVTKDRNEQAGNGSGQFITFNDKGCYDSDKSGYDVSNGFLKFGKSTADRVYYSGNSYWGEAMYIFEDDYKRLNIRVEDSGITYVYVQATPPANVYTCALIKEAKPNLVTPVNPIVVNPVPTPPPILTPDPAPISTKRICPGCNGTGNGHEEIVYQTNYTGNNNSCYCSKCGTTGSCHTHRTTLCKVCYGKKYVE